MVAFAEMMAPAMRLVHAILLYSCDATVAASDECPFISRPY